MIYLVLAIFLLIIFGGLPVALHSVWRHWFTSF